MKTAQDPRHQRRIELMQNLFAYSFGKTQITPEIEPIVNVMEDIDLMLGRAAPEWPVEKIAKTDLSILRLAVYELIYVKEAPAKVIIDEAVELAKAFGNDSSPAFVNGALGAVMKLIEQENK